MSRIHSPDWRPVQVTGNFELPHPPLFNEIIKLICKFVAKSKGSRSKVPSQATGSGRWGGNHSEVVAESCFVRYCSLYLCFSFLSRGEKMWFFTRLQNKQNWDFCFASYICVLLKDLAHSKWSHLSSFTAHGSMFGCYARSLGKSTWESQPCDADAVFKVTYS